MKTILVVDDNAEARELLKDLLTNFNYRVVEAENGQEGLDWYQKEKPDLALIDLEMPVMDGLQLIDAIRKEDQELPIIIISAFVKKYKKSAFEQYGIHRIMTKPLDLKELIQSIKEILN